MIVSYRGETNYRGNNPDLYLVSEYAPPRDVYFFVGKTSGSIHVVDKATENVILSIDIGTLTYFAYHNKKAIVAFGRHTHVFECKRSRRWAKMIKRIQVAKNLPREEPPNYYIDTEVTA
jgi:hypothetical protein